MTKVAVTGATSYTGRFIAQRLMREGATVVNLSRRVDPPGRGNDPAPFSNVPFPAPSVDALALGLDGVDTLYDTHWIRFERGAATYERALAAIGQLLEAADAAGVRRVVHLSVIHASPDAPTKYFRAKARAEELVRASGLGYAIVRPTVTFGPGDILLNNLAWTLRRVPVFGIPGFGQYPIQPVHVEDVAGIAVDAGGATGNVVVDAAGPERFRFIDFVRSVRSAVGSRAALVPLPVPIALAGARIIGLAVGDVVLRRDEVTELEAGLMVSDLPPLGRIPFGQWVRDHAPGLGRRWSSELDRHYRSAS